MLDDRIVGGGSVPRRRRESQPTVHLIVDGESKLRPASAGLFSFDQVGACATILFADCVILRNKQIKRELQPHKICAFWSSRYVHVF
jgi:hypothetical protein